MTDKKPTRLLHLVDNLGRGGVQTWLMLLVRGLAEQGFEQRVYCLNEVFKPDIVHHLETSGAAITVIGRHRLWTGTGLRQLYRDIHAWQPDIIQTILHFSNLIGRPLARQLDVPVVVSSIQARNVHVPKPLLLLDSLTARWADLFITVGRQAIPFAIAHEGVPPEKVIYIPNSIETHQPEPQARALIRAKVRAALGISPATKVLGMVARLTPKKAQHDLLQAYAGIVPRYPHTRLLLVGDGPLRPTLQEQARQLQLDRHVLFLGDRPNVADYLAAMDLFVHPSLSEGMPHAVMEAMAAGLPVIASGVDGVQDLIIDGESGWLVEPAQPHVLAEKIIFALEHQTLWARLGQMAAQRIATEFSPAKMVATYSAVYRDLLAGVQSAGR